MQSTAKAPSVKAPPPGLTQAPPWVHCTPGGRGCNLCDKVANVGCLKHFHEEPSLLKSKATEQDPTNDASRKKAKSNDVTNSP
jgi:hypothetical protein